MLKRILIIFAISIILTATFFEGYCIKYPVFGANVWQETDTLDLQTKAFLYYCKSRDLTIDGSVANAVTNFTSKTYKGLLNTVGIDMNAIQADIKYSTDSTGYKFLFTATGASLMNRIFSQFLQDNDLEVGDSVDEELYSGEWFEDDNGNGCWVTIQDRATVGNSNWDTYMIKLGTAYRYTGYDAYLLTNNATQVKTLNTVWHGNNYTWYLNVDTRYNDRVSVGSSSSTSGTGQLIIRMRNDDRLYDGYVNIIKFSNKYYIGGYYYTPSNSTGSKNSSTVLELVDASADPVDIVMQSTTINNNTYNNNTYTIIYDNGTVNNYYDNDEPDPDTPSPDPPDPDTPSPPDLPSGDGWDDFTLPEMPNDWLIYGMEKKFPFDIPFNIMFALSLLNHEPVIPHFEGDIDLKVCNWHYDIDLAPFDDIATMLRKFEVLAFIIGLAIMTKELINWG